MQHKPAKVVPMIYALASMPVVDVKESAIPVSHSDSIVYPQFYKKSTVGKAITIRNASQYQDKLLYKKWMAENLSIPEDNKEFQKFLYASAKYIYKIGCVKEFLIRENEKPITFIDLIDATQHEISLYYAAQRGDHTLELQPAPAFKKERNFIQDLLQILIEFLFMAPLGVKRIILDVEKLGIDQNWAIGIPFGFVVQSKNPGNQRTLFISTRESFFKIQLQSCLENRFVELRFCKDRDLNRKTIKTTKLAIGGQKL